LPANLKTIMKSSEHKTSPGASRLQAKNKSTFFAKKNGEGSVPTKDSSHSYPVQTKAQPTPFFASTANHVQAKLKIHPGDDHYEKEADNVADRVVENLHSPVVQKQDNDEKDGIQKMRLGNGISSLQAQRAFESPSALEQNSASNGEQEMPVQKKSDGQEKEAGGGLESQLTDSKGKGDTLPSDTRKNMESGFGADFSSVRVHNDDKSAQLNKQLGARAFTHGNDIYFNQGEYQPGTKSGEHLLAHELTHTVQQGAAASVQKKIQKAPAPASNAATVSSEVVDISKGSFEPSEKVKGEIEEAKNGLDVRIKAGEVAEEGTIKIKKDKSDRYDSKAPAFLAVKNPWLQKIPGGVYLHVRIKDSQITDGYATVGTKAGSKDGWAKKLKEGADTLVGLGLKIGQIPDPVNEFSNGTLRLGASNIKLTIGGFLDATLNLQLENMAEPKIEASGKVDVKGVAQGDLKLDNTKGPMTGEVGIAVNFPSFSGEVRATYKADGSIDIRGKASYTGNKLSGSIELIATDEETAKNFAKEAIAAAGGKENAQEAAPPPAVPAAPEGSKKRALAAVGQLTFNLTDWFAGTVNVIVDGAGQITVVGKIAPPKEIILFQQKDWEKELIKLEAKAYYGIPVVGNLNLFANVSLSAIAKLGPAKIYNIEVLGTYSTDPSIQKSIQIAGSINISAYAGLRLRAEGGAGIEILGHDLKFGVGLNADAGVKGYADARPTIGYRDPGEFFISGTMEIAAQPVIGLSGELFIKVVTPWWSPLSDKKWTWPLFSKEWPIGGTMGFKAAVKDYVLGSGKVPEVVIEPVEFDGSKFMSSMVDNNMPDKSGGGKDGGKGKFAEDGSVPAPQVPDPKAKGKETPGKDAGGKKPAGGKGGADKKGAEPKPDELKAMEAAMKKLKELEGHKPMTRAEITTAVENIKKQHKVAITFQAQGSDIWLVSAGGKSSKQPVKVKAIMQPGDDKDLKGTEKDKEQKLAAGIAAISAEDKTVAGDGKMKKEEADKVAKNVEGKHSDVFKSIKVIDAGDNWKYHYIQKAKEGDVPGSKEDKIQIPPELKEGVRLKPKAGGDLIVIKNIDKEKEKITNQFLGKAVQKKSDLNEFVERFKNNEFEIITGFVQADVPHFPMEFYAGTDALETLKQKNIDLGEADREYNRQLNLAESRLKKMAVGDWQTNRANFNSLQPSGEAAARQKYRERFARKLATLYKSAAAQKGIVITDEKALADAEQRMGGMAALHLDQVLGGDPKKIIGFGIDTINQSIGSITAKNIDALDNIYNDFIKKLNQTEKKSLLMNVTLTYKGPKK